MSNNALWWVTYTDQATNFREVLSLSSPDLKDPRKATRRALATAKARLKRKGVKAVITRVQCVG